MPARHAARFGLVLVVLLPAAARPAEPDPDPAEKLLREAGVKTDGPGLLAFVRSRTVSAASQERLAAAVRDLGDDSFDVREKATRELIAAGRAARPFLKRALDDRDLEVVRRAQQCLEAIKQDPGVTQMSTAVQLLARLRPPGTAAALLAYFPCADDETLEELLLDTLVAVGAPDGKFDPAFKAALADKVPLRRAAAAHVLGRSRRAEERRPVLALLKDPDPRVRFEAAAALVRAGERAGVPTLVDVLTEAPLPYAWRAEQLLGRVAGARGPDATLGAGAEGERRKCRAAWAAWWKERGDKVDLARLGREEPFRGLTVVCEFDGAPGGGRIWAFGKDGKPRWEITGLQGPNDVQVLPGGRLLVAERSSNQVTERDRQGKVLWRHESNGNPVSCRRMSNGNTLVATWNEVYEVTPEGKKVSARRERHGIRHATQLPNGHVLYITANGHVVELDAGWKEARSITPAAHAAGASYWASVELLPSGRFLLALGSSNRVVEIDAAGKIVWECTVPSAACATRLRNGNTLVASFDGRRLVEVDRSGKEVRRQTLRGRPFTVRQY